MREGGRRWMRLGVLIGVLVASVVVAGTALVAVIYLRPGEANAVDLSTLGLDAMSQTEIVRPDGTRLAITLPSSRQAAYHSLLAGEPDHGPGARVPGGYVLPVWRTPASLLPDGKPSPTGPVPDDQVGRADFGTELWFLADGAAAPTFVAYYAGNWAVSPDGTILVLTGVALHGVIETPAAIAYRLPSLAVLRGPVLSGLTRQNDPPWVVGISGEQVILDAATPSEHAIGVWDLHTGKVRTRSDANALDVSRDGRVLVTFDVSCLGLVAVDSLVTAKKGSDTCIASLGYDARASVSPDSTWILVDGVFAPPDPPMNPADRDGQSTGLVRVSDLVAGRWSPIHLRPFADQTESATMPYVWASDSTFVVRKLAYSRLPFGGPSFAGSYLCGVDNARCRPLTMPDGLENPLAMGRLGP